MVSQVQQSVRLASESRLPAQAQPWEVMMVVIGLPGAALCAAGTCALAIVGATTDPLVGLGGIASLLLVYLTTVGLLWVGTSAELG